MNTAQARSVRKRVATLRGHAANRNAIEELRWTEAGFRLMVESVVDCAIVWLDPQGLVASWNSGAERIKGYRAEEILGQPSSRFYIQADLDRGAPLQNLDLAIAHGRSQEEGWRVRKDGTIFWANVVITAIRDTGGQLRGFAKLTQDLTERRKVETQLRDARALAEQANLAKSSFLSGMSHELRSPLNAILGFAQLMESAEPPLAQGQQEHLAQILKAGWHLLLLINDILDLAKVESGQVPMAREPVSLAEVLRECHGMIEPQAQSKGVRLAFPQGPVPHFVLGDRTRVKQVLLNLLSNAVKYNRKEGRVEVACRATSRGTVRITVRDTGLGLTPDQVGQLFQPFNRLSQEAGAEEGTGIGLVVAKRLVELMEGTLGVESTPGEGSVFGFELGVAADPGRAGAQARGGAAASPLPVREARRRVLYVEDNPANLKLVEQIIARYPDLELLSAPDALRGLELARQALPAVILMDINLPGLNGFEAMARLRADPATAAIPVLAVSANAMATDLEKGVEAGFFGYVTKPLRVNDFMKTLYGALLFAEQGRTPDFQRSKP